ncbi:hypothetical protein P152DRAFT_48191 [Eremomyces bilateralis CBS 781.70]|uniref:Uncharacterized protein n=1 Tax=Eremomyces bilateralis CBS 781.70 TaxID=1392243 RepID=A0A6G1G0X1_9PEZI|nr:uncharacterized protein P152DRAFT_48191 [Eremomyces bilateralis CBS 781.70]KAF1811668.1 hypothetical protein P152DRAFT_48191 [Eremomyces bilateralis CBS 781.70]
MQQLPPFQTIYISTSPFDIHVSRPRPLLLTFPQPQYPYAPPRPPPPVFSTSYPSYGRPFSSKPTVAIHRGDPSGPVIGTGHAPTLGSTWSIAFFGLGGEGKMSSEMFAQSYTAFLPAAPPSVGGARGVDVEGAQERQSLGLLQVDCYEL